MIMFNGYKVFENQSAVERVSNFRDSKNRSRRVYKKLLKKFKGQYYDRPCAFVVGDKMIVHPEIMKKIKENTYEKMVRNRS